MRQLIPAAFYRGGTSKAVLFRRSDLPAARDRWPAIFCHVLGSPDTYGRQLDGMGGGLSSLSKVAIVGRSTSATADLDYTFAQIAVDRPVADFSAMCGNMASAIGPFAVQSGLVELADGEVTLVIRNTNTDKLYQARFQVAEGAPVEEGPLEIAGVHGTGAPVALRFLNPSGARTGQLLPTGRPRDALVLPSGRPVAASLVDATNPVVFVQAKSLGCSGYENPEDIDANHDLMSDLEALRRAGSVAMGLSPTPESAAAANPKIAMIAALEPFAGLDGRSHAPDAFDISVRLISMGRCHRAVTLTGGMCLAAATQVAGTLADFAGRAGPHIRVAHPSGLLPVTAEFGARDRNTCAALTCFRTQRCLMTGHVPVPTRLLED